MTDGPREDFARCVSRKLGESQSKDVKTDDLQSGWHSKCWRRAFSHTWMFFICPGSLRWLVFLLCDRERRRFCHSDLGVVNLSTCVGTVACTTSDVSAFLMPSHSKPITKGTTLERKNTPMQLIDSVTRARFFSTAHIACIFSVDVAFSIFYTCSDVSAVGIG